MGTLGEGERTYTYEYNMSSSKKASMLGEVEADMFSNHVFISSHAFQTYGSGSFHSSRPDWKRSEYHVL